MLIILLAVAQAAALAVLLWRLLPGIRREPPVPPATTGREDTTVSVLVPTLNERQRLAPCLESLARQGAPLHEVIVIDSDSTDGTEALVIAAAGRDPRIRLERDPPLPDGWIGKVWALEHGLALASGEWILGLDADVELEPGAIAGAVQSARAHRLDVVSFGPRFASQGPGERWLQPALLVTLVYRTGSPSPESSPDRVLANGQFFLARRRVLQEHGGYAPSRWSFADDVTLARHLARAGVRVGFLDGSRLYCVRSYRTMREMWREWGRSIDLSDATTRSRQWIDVAFLALVQALPLPLLACYAGGLLHPLDLPSRILLWLNVVLVLLRIGMTFALQASYERTGVTYFLSWLADPLAVVRVLLSTVRRPRQWRGRSYRAPRTRGELADPQP